MSKAEIIQLAIAFLGGVGFIIALVLMDYWSPQNPWKFIFLMALGGILACIIVPIIPVK